MDLHCSFIDVGRLCKIRMLIVHVRFVNLFVMEKGVIVNTSPPHKVEGWFIPTRTQYCTLIRGLWCHCQSCMSLQYSFKIRCILVGVISCALWHEHPDVRVHGHKFYRTLTHGYKQSLVFKHIWTLSQNLDFLVASILHVGRKVGWLIYWWAIDI